MGIKVAVYGDIVCFNLSEVVVTFSFEAVFDGIKCSMYEKILFDLFFCLEEIKFVYWFIVLYYQKHNGIL